ncbi:MAG TPA: SRPBCC family protein [Nocardioides sp.]|nr:SRPBCC family protein [Nocardioides sp.]
MELTHSFAVPSSVDATWASFQDIAALAECFPGAQVTSVGEAEDGSPTFEGTCKVKLGPIALVYAGAGSFVERDEAGHRFVVDAKGRDKRGNGTAGATVTVTMAPAEQGTQVDVRTDLAITGKPAQFGRGVMQDVSDKLLGQFVTCLEQKLAAESGAASAGGESALAADTATPSAPSSRTPAASLPPPASGDDEALDLGAAVLPILLKSYGKQVTAGLAVLLALVLLLRRRRR